MSHDEMITVLIKTIDNSSYNINVQNSSTVNNLKTIIREHTSVQEDRQRLIYRGRVLLDSSIIQDYNIENGHTIHMVARPENYQELQQAAQANLVSEENQSAATARGVVASLLSSLPILTDARGNAVNNANNIARDTNMEHIRQNLLTMHTLMSIVDPPLPELNPNSDDAAIQDSTVNSHEKGNEDIEISHGRNNSLACTTSEQYPYIKHVQFYIGQWVDVKDTVSQWLEATVMDINYTEKKVFIHYNGWPERWDEWIIWDSPRICPFRSRTSHTALTSTPNTRLNHFSPQPNISIVNAPLTGDNDIRIILPELASMFRRILPFVEEAAILAEESLQSKPPSSSTIQEEPILRTSRPNSGISSIPYRRTTAAVVASSRGSSNNSNSMPYIIPQASSNPSEANITQSSPRSAPGMPWEHVGHIINNKKNTSIHCMQIDNNVIAEKRHIDPSNGDLIKTSNYLSFESDINERNRRQRLCTRAFDRRPSPATTDEFVINYKNSIQSNDSHLSYNNKMDINNITSSYIEENISNSTRKRPAESNMQQAWNINQSTSNCSHSLYNHTSNSRNHITNEYCSTQEKEKRLRILAQDLCPLIDRFGRVLSDIAPHLWNLSEHDNSEVSQRENEHTDIIISAGNDSSTSSRVDNNNDSSDSSMESNRGDEGTNPAGTSVAADSQFSLESSLLSLLRERPPSPPHDRIARAPIALNTRIGMGILPSTGVTARGGASAGNNALLQSLLGDMLTGIGSGGGTTTLASGNTSSSLTSGGGTATTTLLRSTGGGASHASTTGRNNGRQVDIHIAILAPASSRMSSNNSLAATAPTTTATSSHINQRVASLSSSLQAQAENLATRTRQLSERTQQMTGYSAAINDVLRSLREQTNQSNLELSTNILVDSSNSTVTNVESNTSVLSNNNENELENNNEDSNDDDSDNNNNDEHLLDDLIPSLSFTNDSNDADNTSNNVEYYNDSTHILPINISESRTTNHIDIAIMNEEEIMHTIDPQPQLISNHNNHNQLHQNESSSSSTAASGSYITIVSEENREDTANHSSSTTSSPIASSVPNTVYDRLRR